MKTKLVFAVVVLFAVSIYAADFSGTWMLNKDKSELGEGRGARFAATKMIVHQDADSISIESTRVGRDGEERTMTVKVSLDGKENKSDFGRGTSVTTAELGGDALKMSSVRSFERNGESFEMTSTQEWALADDGKSLIIKANTVSSRGEREMKMVYDKE